MKTPFGLVLACTFALLSAGCCSTGSTPATTTSNSKAFDLAAAKQVIQENNRRFTRAHVIGDKATIDNMVTRDAKCFAPNAAPVIGRDAIAELNAQYIAYGISEFTEVTTDFFGNEEFLIDVGSYVMVYGPDKTRETGSYVNIWKQEEGVWKIYTNMWNTDTPPTPAK